MKTNNSFYSSCPADRAARLTLAVIVGLFSFALIRSPVPAEDIAAAKIVAQADEIRLPQRSFEVHVIITSTGRDREPDIKEYDILSKGADKTIVKTTAPALDRGQVLLMRGKDLWLFLPNVSQPVRLSLSQRLTGQVANGDLARANFAGDYAPSILSTDTIKGQAYYVLELKALDRAVTYNRVMYWVNKSNYRPYKAEFYALSGKLLKTCLYENFKESAGALRPITLIMEDALAQGEKSVLEYRNFVVRDLPDKYFNKDYLIKLQ